MFSLAEKKGVLAVAIRGSHSHGRGKYGKGARVMGVASKTNKPLTKNSRNHKKWDWLMRQ